MSRNTTFASPNRKRYNAKVAQLVERDLAKVEVASSNLVFRSKAPSGGAFFVGFFELLGWRNR